MKPTLLASLLFVALAAEPLAPVAVWNGAPPSETLKVRPGQDPKGIINKSGHRTDVMIPEFVVYPAAKPGAPIVIVCPGGGYVRQSTRREGEQYAHWLGTLGIASFVLTYRQQEFGHPAPLRGAAAARTC